MRLQFYLGTTRLQLEHKGGADHIVTSIANVVPAFGFIGIPVIGWLLDRMGYGITLATINFLGVLASFFQAMPNVWFQVRLSAQVPRSVMSLDIFPASSNSRFWCVSLVPYSRPCQRLVLGGPWVDSDVVRPF